ncbi:MAG: hypothetical protein GX548_06600 [Lentisphaerae bacterium]|nr:hypothetical protein [Lentisphaerota bacterium]
MGSRLLRPKRLATLALLAVSVAVGVWWLGYIPYDPMAIYRPVPASASVVGRHLALPDRWGDLLANPLALAMMRTAGADPEEAAWLIEDEASRQWFEKLAGREGVLAYRPGRFGLPPAWMAVSHLGGESQKLRWQLSLFDVPGFERMTQFPGRLVWRVETPDLPPSEHLVIAFGEGVILACLSENPLAMSEVLGAYDGTVRRLLEEELSFKRFAEGDDRRQPDRLWVRDPTEFAPDAAPGLVVNIPVLRGEAMSLSVESEGMDIVPETAGIRADLGRLGDVLGGAPCAAALVPREALEHWALQGGIPSDVRHALRMILEVAGPHLAVVFMDGKMGGRLAWGAMSSLGLSGLRVPTLLLATPVSGDAAAAAAIQRVLDRSNARHRAAFVLRPLTQGGVTMHVLESAGGDEWVDALARSDRPAYAVRDGWLLASSNLDALQKLVRGGETVPGATWTESLHGEEAVSAWLDLARSGKVARDAMATWSMAQMFLDGGSSPEMRERLNEAKTWIDAFVPFGTARARVERRDGRAALSLDLGLFPDGGLD